MTDKNPDFLDEADDIYEESDMADDYLSFSHFASANEVPESSADAHSSPSSATSLPALTANNHRDFTRLRRAAAKSVADSTAQGYASLALQFATYCRQKGWCPHDVLPWHLPDLDPETDYMIMAWIMDACDYEDMDGRSRPQGSKPGTAGHAAKMRSAVTLYYAHEAGRGKEAWNSTNMTGNPAISFPLSSYLRGLRRRKVRLHGEKPLSARAVTADMMKRMYRHNTRQMQSPDPSDWASVTLRIMLQAIMILAFVCFLRIDEVLTLRRHEIKFFYDEEKQNYGVIVTLSHRKTAQNGGVKPFVLYFLPMDKSHLCAVRWLAKWIETGNIKSGYLFPKFNCHLELIQDKAEEHLPADEFILFFRCLLLDIGVADIFAYAGHSFRRGGVQYCSTCLHWTFRGLCLWGGWSDGVDNFSPKTIIRYLISWNDDDKDPRDAFYNGDRSMADFCHQCGRGTVS